MMLQDSVNDARQSSLVPRLSPLAPRPSAFTLIEVMVAMALTLFIMLILTQAFIISLDTFSGLKGIGDMQEALRTGANQLRFDLAQAHFEGKRRPSDPYFAQQQIREGFFAISQGGASISEGVDGDTIGSSRAINHSLWFSSRLLGNQQQSFYSAYVSDTAFFKQQTFYNLAPFPKNDDSDATLRTPASGPYFRSQWAEIAYYLTRTGTTEEPGNPAGTTGTPLYGLYRVQFVVVTDKTNLTVANAGFYNNPPGYTGLSCSQNAGTGNIDFWTPNDLAQGPAKRALQNYAGTGIAVPAALVVPNVVSFQVQGIVNGQNGAVVQDMNYDSANLTPAAANATILQGVFITIRVFDNKTRQTRQMSIYQDL